MTYWGYGSGWGWLLMAASMVVFWVLVIGAIVWIVRAVGRNPTAAPPRPAANPQQVLAERFARGEIDEAEYQNRLAALRRSPAPTR